MMAEAKPIALLTSGAINCGSWALSHLGRQSKLLRLLEMRATGLLLRRRPPLGLNLGLFLALVLVVWAINL